MTSKESILTYVPRLVLIFCLLVSFIVLIGAMNYLMTSRNGNVPAENKLTILTDKAEYEQGEEVKINLINNTGSEMFLTFPSIEVFEPADTGSQSGEWRTLRIVWAGCGVTGGLQYLPLNIGESHAYSWDQQEKWCTGEKPWDADIDFQQAGPGKYRVESVIVKRTKTAQEDPNNISGQPTDIFVYSNEFTIAEKAVPDPSCGQKAKFSGNCEMAVIGFEFDTDSGKCIKKTGSCRVETPFNTLEECQDICETKMDFYSCDIDADCVPVRADCCGCNAGGKATAINKKYILEWNSGCNQAEPVMCPAVMSSDLSCFGVPKCANNKCEIINAENKQDDGSTKQ